LTQELLKVKYIFRLKMSTIYSR